MRIPDLTVRENLSFSKALVNCYDSIPTSEGLFKNLYHLLNYQSLFTEWRTNKNALHFDGNGSESQNIYFWMNLLLDYLKMP